MRESKKYFDIVKGMLNKVKHNDKEYYVDPVREELLPITELETLKEQMLSYLLDNKKIHKDMLKSIYDDSLGEIFIVYTFDEIVLAEDEDSIKPILAIYIVEKIEDEFISNLQKYSLKNSVPFCAILDFQNIKYFYCDINKNQKFQQVYEDDFYNKVSELYHVPDFLNKKLDSFKELKEILSKSDISDKISLFVNNLVQCLFFQKNKKTVGFKNEYIEILKDFGSYGREYDEGSGIYWGQYRNYLCKYRNKICIASIGINDYVSPYRQYLEFKSLYVGFNFNGVSKLEFIMPFDDEKLEIHKNSVTLLHDMRIPLDSIQDNNGYDEGFKQYVKIHGSELLREESVILGEFSLNKLLSIEEDDVKEFILRTFKYALLRKEYRDRLIENREIKTRYLDFDFNGIPEPMINRNNQYFDIVRNQNIQVTAEETVRQKLIRYLIKNVEIPKNRIRVEEALCHYGIKTGDRADIIIENPNNKPLVVIECKAPEVMITKEVKEQMTSYGIRLKCKFCMMTNGNDTECFCYDRIKKEYKQIKSIPKYINMLNGQYETAVKELPLKRLSLNLLKKYPYAYIEIGSDTPADIAFACENLWECLLYSDGSVLVDEYRIFEITEDLGIYSRKFGTSGPGTGFQGDYHVWKVCYDEQEYVISIGLSMYTTENKPDLIRTAICVGVEKDGQKHHSLQLVADDNIVVDKDKVTFYHNGRIGIGNIGSGKKYELKEVVKESYDSICPTDNYKGKRYFNLGTVTNNCLWEFSNPEIKIFIENLISYSLLRDDYRKIKKRRRKR